MKRRPLRPMKQPGGIASLELGFALRDNTRKIRKEMRNPENRRILLSRLPVKGRDNADVRIAKRFPGIALSVKTDSRYKGPSGVANIVDVPNIGPVAYTAVFRPQGELPKHLKRAERRFLRETQNHEEAHIETMIIRHRPLEGGRNEDPTVIREKLLDEIISRTAAGSKKEMQNLSIMPLQGYIGRFAEAFCKKNGLGREKQAELEKKLMDELMENMVAIHQALKIMPRKEVLLSLRRSSFDNMRTDLQKRSMAREKALAKRKGR